MPCSKIGSSTKYTRWCCAQRVSSCCGLWNTKSQRKCEKTMRSRRFLGVMVTAEEQAPYPPSTTWKARRGTRVAASAASNSPVSFVASDDDVYPRPLLVREGWLSLNGEWRFLY